MNNIADDCKVALLTPYLSDAARNLVSTLLPEDVNTHEHFKAALLREFRLTSDKYRHYFDSAKRKPEESFIQFVTRLHIMIEQYLDSREIKEDYETLIELILADKLKLHMSSNIVLRVRNTEGLAWLRPKKLAELADVYEGDSQFFAQSHKKFQDKGSGAARTTVSSLETANNSVGKSSMKCFNCSNFGHKAAACPVKFQNAAELVNFPKSENSTPRMCTYCNKRGHTAEYCFSNPNQIKRSNRVISGTQRDNTENNASNESLPNVVELSISSDMHCATIRRAALYVDNQESGNITPDRLCTLDDNLVSTSGNSADNELGLQKVMVDMGAGAVSAIVDSGTDITVLKPSHISELYSPDSVDVVCKLQGAFHKAVDCKICVVP
jgi:hypothetical protein